MIRCRDEISTRIAGTDFTLRVHGIINFHSCKVGQIFTKVGQIFTMYLLKKIPRFPLI